MATVRITKELTEAIQRNARAKFADRIKAAEDAAPKGTKWGDYIYDKLFGQYVPIMDHLPAEFFHARDSITVSRIGGQSVNLKFGLSSARRWPASFPASLPAESIWSGMVALKDDLIWGELHAEVTAWRTKCHTIREQAREFVEGVSKILTSYSTLAPALKAWPPLWELVPEYTKNKHKEITERRKPEKVAPNVDVNRLTAVLTASKLGGL